MLNLTWRHELCLNDKQAVLNLTAGTGVFSAEEITVAGELVEEKLQQGVASSYQFLFAELAGEVVAYTCFGLIPCTDRRFDLYWIAVDAKLQNQGIGKIILQRSEQIILAQGGERVYAETSGREDYLATRQFYQRNAYLQIAELSDYYRAGDSKIIYCKQLTLID